jgi:carbamoyltransferase
MAIDYCLREVGLTSLDSLDCIVVNQGGLHDFAAELRCSDFQGKLLVDPSHHLLHAYYAAAASGWSNAAILVVDGSGYSYAKHSRGGSPLLGPPPEFVDMDEAESSFALIDGRLELVARRWGSWNALSPYFRFPSLGHMFSAASQYIFGRWTDAGKTMGLAPFGDPTRFEDPIVTYADGALAVDTEWTLRLPPRSDRPAHCDEVCCDLAAKVQLELEKALLFLASRLFESTGLSCLCLAGGVALNSVANARLREKGPFEEIFVSPAAGDSGVAVGAAVYGHDRLCGEIPSWNAYSDFLGARYGDERTEATLRSAAGTVQVDSPRDPAVAAAKDLVAGRVVGWFEGRSELGPRALGHRSIVCDPRGDEMRDHLNEWVKFREPFRPYAAAVLEEHADRYFELSWPDPFMLSVVRVRPEFRALLPSVCHVDDTCRIQTVPPGTGAFRLLIEAFLELTGLPIVLNTSLNIRGEPMVETPEDALRCFLGTNIDLLFLEGRRLEKAVLNAAAPDGDLIPRASRAIAVETTTAWSDGSWVRAEPVVRTRTGSGAQLSDLEARVLLRVDGRSTVRQLARGDELGTADEIAGTLAALQRRGLILMMQGTGNAEGVSKAVSR